VVAISHENDSHLPFVERHLDRPLVVIDPTHITDGSDNELSYEFVDGRERLIYKGEDVSDAISVWYRKPEPVDRDALSIEDRHKDYSMSALQQHIAQLRAQLPRSQWVSDFYAIKHASNKTAQYRTAHELGLKVPDTLITSSEDAAREFLNCYPTTIIKSLAIDNTSDDEGNALAFLPVRFTGAIR
jgi:glutathione synthase/RimK-type ligase-like ATP-grasp enzyme